MISMLVQTFFSSDNPMAWVLGAILLLFVVCFLAHKKGGDQHGAAPAAGTSA